MIRKMLEERRNAEIEIKVIRRQIESCQTTGAPHGYPKNGWKREKVKGKDEYVTPPPGTNNSIGARMQHEDGFVEMLERRLADMERLFREVEAIIQGVPDGEARAILRYYYCEAWTDEAIGLELGKEGKSINRKRNSVVQRLDHKKSSQDNS